MQDDTFLPGCRVYLLPGFSGADYLAKRLFALFYKNAFGALLALMDAFQENDILALANFMETPWFEPGEIKIRLGVSF